MIWIILSLVSPFYTKSKWLNEFFFSLISAVEFVNKVWWDFLLSISFTDKWLNLWKVKICKRSLTNLRTDINNELWISSQARSRPRASREDARLEHFRQNLTFWFIVLSSSFYCLSSYVRKKKKMLEVIYWRVRIA